MLTFWNRPGPERVLAPATLGDLHREVDRLFMDFDRVFHATDDRFRDATQGPRASLRDEGDALVLRAELPGFRESDLEISLERDTLTLRGARTVELPADHEARHRERHAVRFSRSFTLPVRVEADGVEATLRDGLLTLTLPKAAEERPRKVIVRGA